VIARIQELCFLQDRKVRIAGERIGGQADVEAGVEHVAVAVRRDRIVAEEFTRPRAIGHRNMGGSELGELRIVAIIDVGQQDRQIARGRRNGIGDEQRPELGPANGAAVKGGDLVVEGIEALHDAPGAAEGAGEVAEKIAFGLELGEVHAEGQFFEDGAGDDFSQGGSFDGVGGVGGDADGDEGIGLRGLGDGRGGGVEHGEEAVTHRAQADDFAEGNHARALAAGGHVKEFRAGEGGIAGDVAEGGDAGPQGFSGAAAGAGFDEGFVFGRAGAGEFLHEGIDPGGEVVGVGELAGEAGEFEVGVGVDETGHEDAGVSLHGEFAELAAEVCELADGEDFTAGDDDTGMGHDRREGRIHGDDGVGRDEVRLLRGNVGVAHGGTVRRRFVGLQGGGSIARAQGVLEEEGEEEEDVQVVGDSIFEFPFFIFEWLGGGD